MLKTAPTSAPELLYLLHSAPGDLEEALRELPPTTRAAVTAPRYRLESAPLPLAQRPKLARQLGSRGGAKPGVEGALELREKHVGALVGSATALGDGGANRPAVVRIGNASDEAVRLEPIDELGDVRLAAAMPLRQMGERKRFGGEHEVAKRAELGERETDLGQGAFGTRLHGASGVEQEEGECAPRRRGGAATV